MADEAAQKHDNSPTSFISYLFDLIENIQNDFSKFHEHFTKPTEKSSAKRTSNIKFDAKSLPSSFTAEIENYWEFMQALPWKETFMVSLVAFHVLTFLLIISTRKNANFQYIIFFLLLVAVYCSEFINELAAEHHSKFASENFFDSSGLFISTVFSAPVLFNCICLIVIWLSSATMSLIDMKKQQAELNNRREKLKEKDNKKTK